MCARVLVCPGRVCSQLFGCWFAWLFVLSVGLEVACHCVWVCGWLVVCWRFVVLRCVFVQMGACLSIAVSVLGRLCYVWWCLRVGLSGCPCVLGCVHGCLCGLAFGPLGVRPYLAVCVRVYVCPCVFVCACLVCRVSACVPVGRVRVCVRMVVGLDGCVYWLVVFGSLF